MPSSHRPRAFRQQANTLAPYNYAQNSGPVLPSLVGAINSLNNSDVEQMNLGAMRRDDADARAKHEFLQNNTEAYIKWARELDPHAEDFEQQFQELDPRAFEIPGFSDMTRIKVGQRDDLMRKKKRDEDVYNHHVSRLRRNAKTMTGDDHREFERMVSGGSSIEDLQRFSDDRAAAAEAEAKQLAMDEEAAARLEKASRLTEREKSKEVQRVRLALETARKELQIAQDGLNNESVRKATDTRGVNPSYFKKKKAAAESRYARIEAELRALEGGGDAASDSSTPPASSVTEKKRALRSVITPLLKP